MILGIGTDLVEIERIKKACEKEAFLVRSFTEEERRQAEGKIPRLAGDFAVKEMCIRDRASSSPLGASPVVRRPAATTSTPMEYTIIKMMEAPARNFPLMMESR